MIFVLTGNGKGKTTCAFGMALRASGGGKKVCIVQFLKTGGSSEIKAIKNVKNIMVKSFGEKGFIINRKLSQGQKDLAQKAFTFAKKCACDMLILDEINMALYFGFISIKEVVSFIKENKKCNIVLTGRNCPKKILQIADLVTEFKEIKHYYNICPHSPHSLGQNLVSCRNKKGQKAQKGIEY